MTGHATPPTRRHRLTTVAASMLAVVMLLAIGWAAAWRLDGGHWFIVSTPSMGTAAPVGTLLWVEPVDLADVSVGDVISFHPPASPRVVTHRVTARAADGTLTTRGDINQAPDPWKLDDGNLVGRVQMRWWGIGWLIKAMPILVGGGALLWVLLRWFTAPRWRAPLAMVGLSIVVSLSVFVVKPLVRAELMSVRPVAEGGEATYVSTGLLPIRLESEDAGHVDVSAGQVRTLTATTPNDEGRYVVRAGPHLPLWWWAVGAAIVMSPALWTAVVGSPSLARKRGSRRARRSAPPAA